MASGILKTSGGKVEMTPTEKGVVVQYTSDSGEASQAFALSPEQASALGLMLTGVAADAGELRRVAYSKRQRVGG